MRVKYGPKNLTDSWQQVNNGYPNMNSNSGEAFVKLQMPKYDCFRRISFEKTGRLITADRSNDELIKPEGMPEYVVTLPLPTVPADDPFT